MSNEALALLAKSYAQTWVHEGQTQLINNSYDAEKKKALYSALHDIRVLMDKEPEICLAVDAGLLGFEQRIKYVQKFSLGNCAELAYLALDYMMHHAPYVYAEAYTILGGDHEFLVIGRNFDSDPCDPFTWGDDAYICDPWADKVYPSIRYLSELKNFYCHAPDYEVENAMNCLEDFDQDKHELIPIPEMNSYHFKQFNSVEHLSRMMSSFLKMNRLLLAAVDGLLVDLGAIAERLKTRHGEQYDKYLILIKKMDALRQVATVLVEDSCIVRVGGPSHRNARAALEEKITHGLQGYRRSIAMTEEEQRTLNTHRDEHSVKARCKRFFNIPPKVAQDINKALEKSEAIVSTIPKIKVFKS